MGLGPGLGLALANLVDDRAVDGDHLVALAALVVVRELARLVERVAHERVAHRVLHGAQGLALAFGFGSGSGLGLQLGLGLGPGLGLVLGLGLGLGRGRGLPARRAGSARR